MGADVVQCPPMGGLCVKEKQEPAVFWKTFGLAALLWAALAAGSELLFPSSAAAPAGAAGLLRSCLVLPVAEQADEYKLLTRSYVQFDEKTGQAGYAYYRWLDIVPADGRDE